MKALFIIITFFTVGMFGANAQVAVHKDPRMDVIAKKPVAAPVTHTIKKKFIKGYRLLVMSSNSRADAIAAKTKIYTYFPELKTYMWHQSPFYKVKVGNFAARSDAAAYQKKLAQLFPAGVFIMNDTIEARVIID